MSLPKSRRFFGEKKKNKNQGKKASGLFIEVYAVAPAPSRDYYALQLFQKNFTWTKWRICHGPYAAPTQKVVTLEDYKKDTTLQHELTYIFGTDTTNLIDDLANEKWSLTSMPSNVLQKIFTYMSVADILRLSQVCKRFSKECASNELWQSICKKQWKILIHNDIEKASLIGWKTVYLEKMRPKRYKKEAGHHGTRHHHPKPFFSNLSRIQSVSTLNTPVSGGFTAKSNLTMPKRVQELKKAEAVRSTSEIFGKDFKVFSISTGKSTERTYTVARGKTHTKNGEMRPTTGDKLPFSPRRYLQQSSSTVNLPTGTDKVKSSNPPCQKMSARVTMISTIAPSPPTAASKSKVNSVRVRSATTQSIQATAHTNNKLRSDRARPTTGKSVVKK